MIDCEYTRRTSTEDGSPGARPQTHSGAIGRLCRLVMAVATACLVSAVPAASQSVVPVPPGLQPGDQYRLIFVTSSARDATPNDIEVYNAFVTAVANSVPALAALNTTWKAVASTHSPIVHARDNTNTDWTPAGPTGVPIYLVNGSKFARNYDHMWNPTGSDPLFAPPSITELGLVTGGFAWTGTSVQGGQGGLAAYPGVERSFSLGAANANGTSNALFGRVAVTSGLWADGSFGVARTHALPFYAISGILTAPQTDAPPMANAGADFSVDEGQTNVTLDGSGSSDPDGDPLTFAWAQLSGTFVVLANAGTDHPVFDAPLVAPGGETLTFELTVTANGESSTDTVNVTIVNVNHAPVADAGVDQSIAEGSPVVLHGENSFDIDSDEISYAWVQVGGNPVVTLSGANTANPTFTAPVVGSSGAPGVVATLIFELRVDDGFPPDAPASGYSLANVVDQVTIDITNVNNPPTALAGPDQTVDEHTAVALDAAAAGIRTAMR